MIQLDADALNAILSWGTLPAILIAVLAHLKRAYDGLPWTHTETSSDYPWAPLILDGLGVGAVKLMHMDGRLDVPGMVGWPTIILLGIALAIATGTAYDVAWRFRPQQSQPAGS